MCVCTYACVYTYVFVVCVYVCDAAHYGAAPHRERPKKETKNVLLQDNVGGRKPSPGGVFLSDWGAEEEI